MGRHLTEPLEDIFLEMTEHEMLTSIAAVKLYIFKVNNKFIFETPRSLIISTVRLIPLT